MAVDKSNKFLRALWVLLPFFILHLSSGLSGSFTTILIDHFREIQKGNSTSSAVYETLLGTFEDYGPIIVAVLGGFLQQLFGPKKILIAAGIPSFLSWLLVAINPESIHVLLGSRLLAGFSNGLLTGNVYMADVAPSEYISSFKSIEAASRSLGAILIFAITLIFYNVGFRYVAIAAAIFPFLGLVGTFFTCESPIFEERVNDIRLSVESHKNGEENLTGFSLRLVQAKEKLKIPIKSPAVYQPMILITCALCIQHFSGFTFTKKFLLQVLKSPKQQVDQNLTSMALNETTAVLTKDSGIDEKAYFFAMLINFIRFISNLLMARFLRSFRIRSLYFLSLFATSFCLIILGFLEEDKMLAPYFSNEVDQYLKVSILAVHVFCVQFGLQSLSGQLTDILLPSNSKAIMKGVIRAIQALTLLIFVTIMKQFEEHWSFWIMAMGLICVSPLLYTFIPELKNLGRTSGEFFFLPSQTLFYVVLPLNDARKKWKNAINKAKAMVLFSKGIQKRQSRLEVPSDPQEKWWHWKSFEVTSNKNKNITLIPDTMDTLRNDERLQKLNRDRVCFVTNILGQNGFLNCNDTKSRICIGRGPISFPDGAIRKGGVFLFDDLIIVARKVVQNRRYMNEQAFKFTDNFQVRREEASLVLISENNPGEIKINLETANNASLWEKYVKFAMRQKNTDIESTSEDCGSEDDSLLENIYRK